MKSQKLLDSTQENPKKSPLNGKIRSARCEDAQAILEIYAPYILTTAASFETTLPTLTEMQNRISEYSKLGFLVYELDDEIIGYAYASKHRERAAYQWCCEVSAYIKEKYHGKSIASALYRTLFAQLKKLGYINAYAGITLPNVKSVGFHEAWGFKHIGTYEKIGYKFAHWHDVGSWGLKIQEPTAELVPPQCNDPAGLNANANQQRPEKTKIARTFSGAPWEKTVGYCRAIRVGDIVAVTGTVSLTEDGKVFAAGKPYEQAKRCLEIIEKALAPLGACRENIIRTRLFVTDISRWNEFGRAHGEFFVNHPPATSMIEVKGLIDSEMLVEIEADAIVQS